MVYGPLPKENLAHDYLGEKGAIVACHDSKPPPPTGQLARSAAANQSISDALRRGEAPEEADIEAPLLDYAAEPGGHIAVPPSTGFSISWEALTSPFVSVDFEDETAKLTRCLFRALSILLWLLVVDTFRGDSGLRYLMGIIMAVFICSIWTSLPSPRAPAEFHPA